MAIAIARGRIAIGLAALAAPGLATRIMFGGREGGTALSLLVRMLGARDLALGLGVVIALDRGAPVRGWLEASALADGGDFVAALMARHSERSIVSIALVAVAGGAAAANVALSRQLDPPPPADPGHPEAVVTGHPANGAG